MVKAFRVPDNYSFVLWWNMWAVVLYRGRNGRDFNVKNPIFTAAGSLNACVCVCVGVRVCVWWQWGWGPLTLRQLPGSSSSVSQSSCQVNLPSRETFLWTSLFPSSGLDKFLQPVTKPHWEGRRGMWRGFHCCCSCFWENLIATHSQCKTQLSWWVWGWNLC